ncbi:hypothetical protein L1889_13070 [Paenalcaligenes niemegkensis]|uniref:hypothetical protein n=1 Tax=Paenalcaligenes niemegkensis TaxID=2895469 RepID=UPI001EE8C5C4|nr:hypothetical protein [Paenalcaligenes niemegkensis]MCQ9617499.1 hypothetical protein [Paenalcaligenes niemegkensis]
MYSPTPVTPPAQGTYLYSSVAVFLLGAVALVISSGYSIGAALLLIGGIYTVCKARPLNLSKEDWLIIGALLFYGSVGIADALLRDVSLSAYDKPLRFLLACFAMILVLKYPPRLCWLWSGLAVGALFAGVWAGYQKLFLLVDRAGGYTHVIQFGNISMLMGFMCLAGIGWASVQPHRNRWLALLIAGALAGIAGSAFSGSRGGWVGLPLVMLVLWRAYYEFFLCAQKLSHQRSSPLR